MGIYEKGRGDNGISRRKTDRCRYCNSDVNSKQCFTFLVQCMSNACIGLNAFHESNYLTLIRIILCVRHIS